jgi:hypothetical protein
MIRRRLLGAEARVDQSEAIGRPGDEVAGLWNNAR